MVALLRLLGRGELSTDEYARLRVLIESERATRDPRAFVAELALRGLMPLAYRHLAARAPFAVDDALAAALSSAFKAHAIRRLQLARRLREILAALRAAGVDVLPYKGPALAIQLYGNYAMRQYSDLDLLVTYPLAHTALAVLDRLGVVAANRDPASWQAFLRERRRHDFALRDRDGHTLVELHWSLADRIDGIDIDLKWFMGGRESVDLLGETVEVMNAERQVLALSIHGARHLWARASWLADLAELIRVRPGLDWDVVRAQARTVGFERALAASVQLAHEWFDAPRPPWLRNDAAVERLAEVARAQLLSNATPYESTADRLRWGWHASATAAARARLLWRVATTPSQADVSTDSLRPAFAWMYAFPRGLRLVRAALAQRRADRSRA